MPSAEGTSGARRPGSSVASATVRPVMKVMAWPEAPHERAIHTAV